MADVAELHRRSVQHFGSLVEQVPPERWSAPTPCEGWDVRALVNHLVYEELWTPPMFAGQTVEEIGTRYDGDVLGADPAAAWRAASADAVSAVCAPGALSRTVHLSFGDHPGAEYAMQLFADHLVHGWDLARASGADERMDPDLVEACATWYAEREQLYRGVGVVADRPPIAADADAQTRLLAAFGRSA